MTNQRESLKTISMAASFHILFLGEDTFCVIAHKVALKVRNIINKGTYDVVKVEWLLMCIEKRAFITWLV